MPPSQSDSHGQHLLSLRAVIASLTCFAGASLLNERAGCRDKACHWCGRQRDDLWKSQKGTVWFQMCIMGTPSLAMTYSDLTLRRPPLNRVSMAFVMSLALSDHRLEFPTSPKLPSSLNSTPLMGTQRCSCWGLSGTHSPALANGFHFTANFQLLSTKNAVILATSCKQSDAQRKGLGL
jgi:hypothetical protein